MRNIFIDLKGRSNYDNINRVIVKIFIFYNKIFIFLYYFMILSLYNYKSKIENRDFTRKLELSMKEI